MADAPTPGMLDAFRRLYQEAQEVSLSHDEFLALIFMAAVDIERSGAAEGRWPNAS